MDTPLPPEARQALADELAPVAVELAERIRHDHPDVLYEELLTDRPPFQLACLCLLLAAAGDISVSPEIWWGWARYREAIESAAPIVWADDQVRIEDMTSEQINALIAHLAGKRKSDAEIGRRVGLSREAVAQRRSRARATERAGVAG